MVGNRLVFNCQSIMSCAQTRLVTYCTSPFLDVLAITRVGCWQQYGSAVTLTNKRRWPGR